MHVFHTGSYINYVALCDKCHTGQSKYDTKKGNTTHHNAKVLNASQTMGFEALRT